MWRELFFLIRSVQWDKEVELLYFSEWEWKRNLMEFINSKFGGFLSVHPLKPFCASVCPKPILSTPNKFRWTDVDSFVIEKNNISDNCTNIVARYHHDDNYDQR